MLRPYRIRTTRNTWQKWAAIAGLLFIVAVSTAMLVK